MGRLGVAIDTVHDMNDHVPRDSAGPGQRVPDHQPPGHRAAEHVRRRGATARRGLVGPARNGTKRFPQRVSRPKDLCPGAGTVPQAHHRHRWSSVRPTCPTGTPFPYPATTPARSGSDAVQELAFTIAQGMAYVESALARGMPVDSFAPRLSFFFGVHNDLFEEIAKFRAARRMWGPGDERALWGRPLRVHAHAIPHANAGLHADASGRPEQHRAGYAASSGRRAGRHPVAPRQRLRRGLRHTLRGSHADVAGNAAHHRP